MFSYRILQLGTETVRNTPEVVKEIRFMHCFEKDGNVGERLYVVHLNYDGDQKLITREQALENPSILNSYIENTLGAEQIQHMKNLFLKEARIYTDLT